MASLTSSNVRKRNIVDQPNENVGLEDVNSNRPSISSHPRNRLPNHDDQLPGLLIFLLIFLFYSAIFYFIVFECNRYPHPVSDSDQTGFSEIRAWRHLHGIINQNGVPTTRPVGTYGNEVAAPEYIKRALEEIKASSNSLHEVEIDVQIVTGSFVLSFLRGFTTNYHNIRNIAARVSTKHLRSKYSLLVNCHYDTVPGSPGASDDAVSCANMLETLNVISKSSQELRHSIIFLFNGAEENILQASHGFITQHKWAKSVKAFVNLEAAGAGGREMVFQSGPDHPWLIHTYAKSAPHPFASVLGKEVFESGFIPSDTDFRIYRDFGHIPGLDIAYISNGYIYHTKYDLPRFIPPGCIQRGGENLVAVVSALANSTELTNPGEYRHGMMVFFDVVGFFLILYPHSVAVVINSVTCLLAMVGVLRSLFSGPDPKHPFKVIGSQYAFHVILAVFFILVSWILSAMVTMATALFLTLIGRTMSWYTYKLNVFGLYVTSGCLALIVFHRLLRKHVYRKFDHHMQVLEAVFFDASKLLWSVLLVTLTYLDMGSAYLAMMWLLFPVVFREFIGGWLHINATGSVLPFVSLHLFSIFPAVLTSLHMFYGTFEVFIPLMGRIGQQVIPDTFIAGLVILLIVVSSGYQIGIIYLCDSMKRVIQFLALIFSLNLLAVCLTPVGFPYHYHPDAPRVHRSIISHVERSFHDKNGNLVSRDSGLWFAPMDYNELDPLIGVVPKMEDFHPHPCDGPYCGLPFYFPMLGLIRNNWWRPTPPPSIRLRVKPSLISRKQLSPNIQRLTFQVSGPDHINVFISPVIGVHLISWSFSQNVPLPSSGPPEDVALTYFVYYSYGDKPKLPWTFSIDLQEDKSIHGEDIWVKMAFSGHYLHEEDHKTKELEEFEHSAPDWTYVMPFVASYDLRLF